MSWFALRAVYQNEAEPSAFVYEERIVLYEAASAEAAFDLAEAESLRYLSLNPGFQRIGDWVCFDVHLMNGAFHGTEVWSGLLESPLEPSKFYTARYREFEATLQRDDPADGMA